MRCACIVQLLSAAPVHMRTAPKPPKLCGGHQIPHSEHTHFSFLQANPIMATDEEVGLMEGVGTAAGVHWRRPPVRALVLAIRRLLACCLREFDCFSWICIESMMASLVRMLVYAGLLFGADFAAHTAGVFEGATLWSEVRMQVQYLWTGVAVMASADIEAEAAAYASALRLRPGMTVCEMGAADGALLARVGKRVMPGGTLIATAPSKAELAATSAAAAAAGLGKVQTFLATPTKWALGLPPRSCDAIYSRMVIHMVRATTIKVYIPQWAAALRPGGRMFMTDHEPYDGGHPGGSTRWFDWAGALARGIWLRDQPGWVDRRCRPVGHQLGVLPGMYVLPSETEVAEIVAGGFELLEGPHDHPYFGNGYGAVYTVRHKPTSNETGGGGSPHAHTDLSARKARKR